jgi:hypothetical protein
MAGVSKVNASTEAITFFIGDSPAMTDSRIRLLQQKLKRKVADFSSVYHA